jgi:hypothetical protein
MSAAKVFGILERPGHLEELDAKIAAHRERRYVRTLTDEQIVLRHKIRSHVMSAKPSQ